MMSRWLRLRRLVLVLVAAAVLATAPAAAIRAQEDDGATLDVVEVRSDTFPRITVRLNAVPGTSMQAAGLSAEQFRVFEDGKPQPSVGLYQLRGVSAPSTVILALDVSGSMADQARLPHAREAAKRFLGQLRPGDRAAIVSFAEGVTLNQSFTNDRALLTRAIDRLTAGGETALYDALGQSVTRVAQVAVPNARRAVVLLTDGEDTRSRTGVGEAIAAAARSDVPVYTIGLGSESGAAVLQRIAAETGGRYYHAPAGQDLAAAFRLISRQIGSRYELYWESRIQGEPGRDVPVEIRLAAGSGATAGFTYRLPTFSRMPRVQLAPANVSQALIELPPAAPPNEGLVLGVGLLAGLGIAMLLAGFAFRVAGRRLERRMAVFLAGQVSPGAASGPASAPLLSGRHAGVNPLTALSARLAARVLPYGLIRRVRRMLTQAGFAGERNLAVFLATELVLAVLLGVLGSLLVRQFGLNQRSPLFVPLIVILLGVIGFYLPYMWLRRRVEARQHAMLRELPDALDLMAIGVSAGLSLDGAMLEVVQKWEGHLSRELNLVLNEIRMGIGRRQALLNLAERTQLDDIRLLVAALIQADEIGANVSETLNVQAEQLRMRRRQRAEELARKAPVKMLIPLIFFIFPSLFVVILAPAMLHVIQTLRRFSGSGG